MSAAGWEDGRVRIAALGTSLTSRGVWLEQLPQALQPLLGCAVHALKFASSGASSRFGIGQVENVLEAAADVVTIEFATNDAAVHRGVSLQESEANITTIVRRLRGASAPPKIYLMIMGPVLGARRILRPRLARYYEVYSSIAEQETVGLIDTRSAWRALSCADLRRSLPDGLHPTSAAELRQIVPCVARRLAEDLRFSSASLPESK